MSEIIRPKVQLESPFGASTREGLVTNVAYALIAMRDSLARGEAPFASHLLYTQMLDDTDEHERTVGIEAGLVIGQHAVLTAVYEDLGVSRGMHYGIERADAERRPVVYRKLFDTALAYDELAAQIHADSPLPLDVIESVYARIHKD